jgi:hypothetical protein
VWKKSEAELQLDKMGKKNKIYFIKNGAFPIGQTQALPPWPCLCPDGCGVVPAQAWAADPLWSALGFVMDQPTHVRYSYESVDGTTFRATAVSDNCNGVRSTYVLEGSSTYGPTVGLLRAESR